VKNSWLVDRIPHNNEPGVGVALQNICEQRAGGLASGMRIHDVNLSDGRLKLRKSGARVDSSCLAMTLNWEALPAGAQIQ